MFNYTDPTLGSVLQNSGALETYQRLVNAQYDNAAREPRSAFTWLEAVSAVNPNTASVSWRAFPLLAIGTSADIDLNRFSMQEEYVEWIVHRKAGRVEQIVFTTEFMEWYQALAQVSFDTLVAGIRSVVPGANPTPRELLGTDGDPQLLTPRARSRLFGQALRRNPWNNGEKGILCLSHPSNTMGALFGLLSECGIVRSDAAPGDVCGLVGGACVPGRSSDPAVCTATQEVARDHQALSLADPAAIKLLELTGVWELDGKEININDPASNRGAWTISRGGLRGVLTNLKGLRVAGAEVDSGAPVARQLRVGTSVLTVPEAQLPVWARTSNESLGRGGAQ